MKPRLHQAASFGLLMGVITLAGCTSGPSRDAPPEPPPTDESAQTILARVTAPGVFYREDPTELVGNLLPVDNENPCRLRAGGSWVRSVDGGKLLVFYPDGAKEYTSNEWEVIPYVVDKRQLRLMPRYQDIFPFPRAGKEREPGDGPQLYSPVSHHLVRPASLIFRWRPFQAGTIISLLILDRTTGTHLWQKSVDGGGGSLTDVESRESLERWRARSPNNERTRNALSLGLRVDGATVATAEFDLVEVGREVELEQELKLWEDDGVSKGVVRQLGRSASFRRYDLPAEAADAAEEALMLAPNDPLVRRAAAGANRLIGNLSRAQQIEKGDLTP